MFDSFEPHSPNNKYCSVQFSSVSRDFLQPHGLQHARLPCPSPNLLELTSIKSVMPSNHLILCRPLLLLSSIFLNIRIFSNKSFLHIRWPKYWRFFSFSFGPSNEYSALIPLRIECFHLFAVQGTLKSLLQHHTVQKHQFFGTQLSL